MLCSSPVLAKAFVEVVKHPIFICTPRQSHDELAALSSGVKGRMHVARSSHTDSPSRARISSLILVPARRGAIVIAASSPGVVVVVAEEVFRLAFSSRAHIVVFTRWSVVAE